MIQRLVNNPVIWGISALVLIYCGIVYWLEGQVMVVSTNAVRLVVAAIVGIAWLPFALYYIWEGRPIRRGYLIIGICGSWLAEALLGAIVVSRQFSVQPYPWYLSAEAIVAMVFVSIGCGVLHLTSGTMQAGESMVPTKGWLLAAGAIGVGIAVAVILVGYLGTPFSAATLALIG